jgi:urease accessory protein
MRRAILIVASLAAVTGLLLLVLGADGRRAMLTGLTDPLLGFDHFLAFLAVGVWAGRLRSPDLWVLPAAFLGGMVPGFMLAVDQVPIPLADILVHIVILGSILSFVAAILIPVRLPTREAVTTLAMIGGCHGYVHGHEVGGGAAAWFGLGALVGAAVLLAAGAVVGLAAPRAE